MRGGGKGRSLERRLLCCLSPFDQSEFLTNLDYGGAGSQPQLPGDHGHETQPVSVSLKEEARLNWHVQSTLAAKGALSLLMN